MRLAETPNELELAGGIKISRLELVLIELFRQRRSDAYIRRAMALPHATLLRASALLREKITARHDECLRHAADRLEIPRIEDL